MAAIFAALFMKNHNNCITKGKCCQKTISKEGIPEPHCVHRVLTKEDVGDNDVIVVGDVHGCVLEVQELVNKVNEMTDNKCKFIFCGDIINKGPHSKETLNFIRSLGSKAYVIRGNNEDRVLKHSLNMRKIPNYFSGLKQRYKWLPDLTDDDLEYLVELPYTLSLPHLSAIVVHAGFFPYLPICCQAFDDMINMRNVRGVDNLCDISAAEHPTQGIPWPLLWNGPQHVYFGHDARKGLQLHPFATGLDTGCVYGKKLTAIFLTRNQEYVVVHAKETYVDPKDPIVKS